MKASERLRDGIQSWGFSRLNVWGRIQTEDETLMERSDVAEWLQLMESHNYRQLAKSNFYDEGRAFVGIGADFGTAIMFRQNNRARNIPSYQALHIKNCVILEDENGEVDTLFRDLWLSAFDAAMWFQDSSVLPRQIKDALDQGNTKRWKFTQFILPLEKFELDIGARETKGMPYYSLYIADVDQKNPIREGGYEVKPFWAWRFARSPSAGPWGCDAPGFLEISNQRQLGGMRKDYNRLVQRLARPPLKAVDKLRGRIDLTPDGITYLKAGEDFTEALGRGSPTGLFQDIQEIRKSINDSYHTDLFLMLSANLEKIKTATLAQGIQGEQAAMLTSFFGRLSMEFLEPSQEDLVQLELDAGRAPPPPKILLGHPIKVDLVSPLAQLQKRYLMLDNTRQALTEIVQLAGLDKQILDKFNFDRYADLIGEMYHIDRRIVRDMIDVERIRKARAQQNAAMLQAQMQMEAAKSKAQTYDSAAKAPEAGSPAAKAMEQANA